MTGIRRRGILAFAGTAGAAWLAAPRRGGAQTRRTVADTLAADGRFQRFLETISRAGLTDYLRGPGPFTVFAPTDTAFLSANAALMQDLLAQGSAGTSGASPDPVRLPAFVRYHILEGQALTLAGLPGGELQVQTVNGAPLAIVLRPGAAPLVSNPRPVTAQGGFGAGGLNVIPPATVVEQDMPATNGLVQVIDRVLFV